MRLDEHFSLFRNKFNKFNNTRKKAGGDKGGQHFLRPDQDPNCLQVISRKPCGQKVKIKIR